MLATGLRTGTFFWRSSDLASAIAIAAFTHCVAAACPMDLQLILVAETGTGDV